MKTFILTLALMLSGFAWSQTTHIAFPENVNAPLNNKEKALIEEVYGPGATYVMERPSLLRTIKDLLRNRISVIELPYEKAQGAAKFRNAKDLNQVPLYNHYNRNLMRDAGYNSNFNILKYDIEIVPEKEIYYKLNNHYIKILPQAKTK